MKKRKMSRQPDPTGDFVAMMLCDLAETGVPEAVEAFRAFLEGRGLYVTLIPDLFDDGDDFYIAHQSVSLLRKYQGNLVCSAPPATRRARALESFLDSEASCIASSLHLERALFMGGSTGTEDQLLMERARSFVHRVLGKFSWDVALKHCAFGPGASVGVKRRQAHAAEKIGHESPTVTGKCRPLLEAYKAWDPLCGASISGTTAVVSGSRWDTVPKDSEKDRTICIEPLWNMFFQKGIGGLIRDRLRHRGLNLDTQQFRNKEAARQGSVDGSNATIDLSNASDTVSLKLCEYLLPEDWFEAVCTTRSDFVSVDGRELLLRKVSSMGNGFTFELESLIFLSLAWACAPAGERSVGRDVMAFGDDIVCPTVSAARTVELLNFCGFTVNRSKSYLTGPFRESCGGDYFGGHDVTPIRIKTSLSSIPRRYWLFNQVRRQWNRRCETRLSHFPFTGLMACVLESIPRHLRLYIPDGIGDVGLVASWDEVAPGTVRRQPNWVEGYSFRRLAMRSGKPGYYEGAGALWHVLWTRYRVPNADLEYASRRPGPERLGISWGTSRQWPHMAAITANSL